jgi:membrane associated rhomboid family serine protease
MIPIRLDIDYERRAWLTWGVVAVNVAAFAWLLTLEGADLEYAYLRFGFRPDEVSPLAAVTSMFLHGGWLHLFFNMFFLWVYGRALEQSLSRGAWATVYLASGFAAVAVHWAFTPATMADEPAVGASGAISGMLAAAALLHPRDELLCLYFFPGSSFGVLTRMPSAVALAAWFLTQLGYAAFTADVGLGVAFWAHVGGFAGGAVTTSLLHQRWLRGLAGPQARPDVDPATAWLEARASGAAPSSSVAASAVRMLSRLGHPETAGAVLKDYLRGPGDPDEEDRLLLEGGRALLRLDPAASTALLQALVAGHPSSPFRAGARKILGA